MNVRVPVRVKSLQDSATIKRPTFPVNREFRKASKEKKVKTQVSQLSQNTSQFDLALNSASIQNAKIQLPMFPLNLKPWGKIKNTLPT